MAMKNHENIFRAGRIGPVELRNRTIRSAAFEGMGRDNGPTDMLLDYHRRVAEGGVGMTTLAYASVSRSGLSFTTQLWLRPEIEEGLRRITDAIHAAGAKASIQIGHCGNMTHKSTAGCTPVGASTGFNLYSPTFVRGLKAAEIKKISADFGEAVNCARRAGFDCVEVHAGHGYLLSQFLSPYTNRRRDEFGGSLTNRMRFMQMAMDRVMEAAGNDMGVLVKMNMDDGFRSGMHREECLEVAGELLRLGAHALVLSGGFVSKAPMYVMRGEMPIYSMTHYMKQAWLKYSVRMFGGMMIPREPFPPLFPGAGTELPQSLPRRHVGICGRRYAGLRDGQGAWRRGLRLCADGQSAAARPRPGEAYCRGCRGLRLRPCELLHSAYVLARDGLP